MNRLLCALLAAAVLAVPRSAEAQVLGTYCYPGQSWCFNATAFSFSTAAVTSTQSRYSYSLSGVFSGSAFTGVTGLNWWAWVTPPGYLSSTSSYFTMTPGTPTTATGYTYAPNGITEFSYSDIYLNVFGDGLSQEHCGGSSGTPCVPPVSVPEPGALLLILTGLAGLGFVSYRRRGAAVA